MDFSQWPVLFGMTAELKSLPGHFSRKVDHTMDWSPVSHQAHIETDAPSLLRSITELGSEPSLPPSKAGRQANVPIQCQRLHTNAITQKWGPMGQDSGISLVVAPASRLVFVFVFEGPARPLKT